MKKVTRIFSIFLMLCLLISSILSSAPRVQAANNYNFKMTLKQRIFPGDKKNIKAKVYVGRKKINISAKEISYASSDNNIVTVDRNGNLFGKKAGVASITCKYKGAAAKVKVTVSKRIISITGYADGVMPAGIPFRLDINGYEDEQKIISSNPSIVKVYKDNNGGMYVMGLKEGTADLVFTKNGIKTVFKIKVLSKCSIDISNFTCDFLDGHSTVCINVKNNSDKEVTLKMGLTGDEYGFSWYKIVEGETVLAPGETGKITLINSWDESVLEKGENWFDDDTYTYGLIFSYENRNWHVWYGDNAKEFELGYELMQHSLL